MQPIAPIQASLPVARQHLVVAQDFAARVANAPTVDTLANLAAGISAAARSAAELLSAEPRSDFQDLGMARRHVIEGRMMLEYAAQAANGPQHGDSAAEVKLLASNAFDAFENAFEIIDND